MVFHQQVKKNNDSKHLSSVHSFNHNLCIQAITWMYWVPSSVLGVGDLLVSGADFSSAFWDLAAWFSKS